MASKPTANARSSGRKRRGAGRVLPTVPPAPGAGKGPDTSPQPSQQVRKPINAWAQSEPKTPSTVVPQLQPKLEPKVQAKVQQASLAPKTAKHKSEPLATSGGLLSTAAALVSEAASRPDSHNNDEAVPSTSANVSSPSLTKKSQGQTSLEGTVIGGTTFGAGSIQGVDWETDQQTHKEPTEMGDSTVESAGASDEALESTERSSARKDFRRSLRRRESQIMIDELLQSVPDAQELVGSSAGLNRSTSTSGFKGASVTPTSLARRQSGRIVSNSGSPAHGMDHQGDAPDTPEQVHTPDTSMFSSEAGGDDVFETPRASPTPSITDSGESDGEEIPPPIPSAPLPVLPVKFSLDDSVADPTDLGHAEQQLSHPQPSQSTAQPSTATKSPLPSPTVTEIEQLAGSLPVSSPSQVVARPSAVPAETQLPGATKQVWKRYVFLIEKAGKFGMTLKTNRTQDLPYALCVGTVTPGGSAARAGLRSEDVLCRIDGNDMRNTSRERAKNILKAVSNEAIEVVLFRREAVPIQALDSTKQMTDNPTTQQTTITSATVPAETLTTALPVETVTDNSQRDKTGTSTASATIVNSTPVKAPSPGASKELRASPTSAFGFVASASPSMLKEQGAGGTKDDVEGDDETQAMSLPKQLPSGSSVAQPTTAELPQGGAISDRGVTPGSDDTCGFVPYTSVDTSRISISDYIMYLKDKIVTLDTTMQELAADSNSGFLAQFNEISAKQCSHSTKIAAHEDNIQHNRFSNVLPFDHSLVGGQEGENTGYINASFVDGPFKKHAYIATQAPVPESIERFWTTVCRQGVRVIAMLLDSSSHHFHRYWEEPTPASIKHEESNSSLAGTSDAAFSSEAALVAGDVTVTCQSVEELSSCVKRTLNVTYGDVTHVVTHLQFAEWDARGLPTTSQFYAFVQLVRQMCETTTEKVSEGALAPLLVHCSTGVDRTGVFLALCSLFELLEGMEEDLSIPRIIANLRHFRGGMVASPQLFVFIYRAWLHALKLQLRHAKQAEGMPDLTVNLLGSAAVTASPPPSPSPLRLSPIQEGSASPRSPSSLGTASPTPLTSHMATRCDTSDGNGTDRSASPTARAHSQAPQSGRSSPAPAWGKPQEHELIRLSGHLAQPYNSVRQPSLGSDELQALRRVPPMRWKARHVHAYLKYLDLETLIPALGTKIKGSHLLRKPAKVLTALDGYAQYHVERLLAGIHALSLADQRVLFPADRDGVLTQSVGVHSLSQPTTLPVYRTDGHLGEYGSYFLRLDTHLISQSVPIVACEVNQQTTVSDLLHHTLNKASLPAVCLNYVEVCLLRQMSNEVLPVPSDLGSAWDTLLKCCQRSIVSCGEERLAVRWCSSIAPVIGIATVDISAISHKQSTVQVAVSSDTIVSDAIVAVLDACDTRLAPSSVELFARAEDGEQLSVSKNTQAKLATLCNVSETPLILMPSTSLAEPTTMAAAVAERNAVWADLQQTKADLLQAKSLADVVATLQAENSQLQQEVQIAARVEQLESELAEERKHVQQLESSLRQRSPSPSNIVDAKAIHAYEERIKDLESQLEEERARFMQSSRKEMDGEDSEVKALHEHVASLTERVLALTTQLNDKDKQLLACQLNLADETKDSLERDPEQPDTTDVLNGSVGTLTPQDFTQLLEEKAALAYENTELELKVRKLETELTSQVELETSAQSFGPIDNGTTDLSAVFDAVETAQMVAIHITKNEGAPLGMLLKTTTVGVGELRRNVIAVKSLSETGLAIAAGVQVGDVILAVNDTLLVNLSKRDAQGVIQQYPTAVHLLISRVADTSGSDSQGGVSLESKQLGASEGSAGALATESEDADVGVSIAQLQHQINSKTQEIASLRTRHKAMMERFDAQEDEIRQLKAEQSGMVAALEGASHNRRASTESIPPTPEAFRERLGSLRRKASIKSKECEQLTLRVQELEEALAQEKKKVESATLVNAQLTSTQTPLLESQQTQSLQAEIIALKEQQKKLEDAAQVRDNAFSMLRASAEANEEALNASHATIKTLQDELDQAKQAPTDSSESSKKRLERLKKQLKDANTLHREQMEATRKRIKELEATVKVQKKEVKHAQAASETASHELDALRQQSQARIQELQQGYIEATEQVEFLQEQVTMATSTSEASLEVAAAKVKQLTDDVEAKTVQLDSIRVVAEQLRDDLTEAQEKEKAAVEKNQQLAQEVARSREQIAIAQARMEDQDAQIKELQRAQRESEVVSPPSDEWGHIATKSKSELLEMLVDKDEEERRLNQYVQHVMAVVMENAPELLGTISAANASQVSKWLRKKERVIKGSDVAQTWMDDSVLLRGCIVGGGFASFTLFVMYGWVWLFDRRQLREP
eukprot:m.188483 g.188483  ORF g.188483 m.188483 type:complete len:2350 (-) comp14787_c0_seq25:93-7142(-)